MILFLSVESVLMGLTSGVDPQEALRVRHLLVDVWEIAEHETTQPAVSPPLEVR